MHGSVTLTGGRLFVLEFCGSGENGGGHVWKEWDTTTFGEDSGIPLSNDDIKETSLLRKQLVARGAADNTTMATFSIKVYLTPEFAAETLDVEGFVAQAIAETNQVHN
jgi:hypothetical protein